MHTPHVIVATDGSQASLAGARQFKWIADSREITDVTIIAVVTPYAAVPVVNEPGPQHNPALTELSFRDEARDTVNIVAAEFAGWGPKIHTDIRSGSPGQEIIRVGHRRGGGRSGLGRRTDFRALPRDFADSWRGQSRVAAVIP